MSLSNLFTKIAKKNQPAIKPVTLADKSRNVKRNQAVVDQKAKRQITIAAKRGIPAPQIQKPKISSPRNTKKPVIAPKKIVIQKAGQQQIKKRVIPDSRGPKGITKQQKNNKKPTQNQNSKGGKGKGKPQKKVEKPLTQSDLDNEMDSYWKNSGKRNPDHDNLDAELEAYQSASSSSSAAIPSDDMTA